jgi:hypothetical protein
MKNFIKYTLATVTGIILTSIIFFIIMIASLSAMIASGGKAEPINENSILVLKAGFRYPTGEMIIRWQELIFSI